MERSEFTESAPGHLVDLAVKGEMTPAFIPAFLPPDISITVSLLGLVAKAGSLLGEVVGQARNAKNIALITRPLATREAIASNRIEGTHTEPLEILLGQAGHLPEDPKRAADVKEVTRYFRAYEMGEECLIDERPLTIHCIRSLHEQLLQGVRGEDKEPGKLRTIPVYIGNREKGIRAARVVPPPPEHVQPLLEDFERFLIAAPQFEPLIDVAIQHYQFETIHPFIDGNGRLGRLLIPLYLRSQNRLDKPVLYLSDFFEERGEEYKDRLKRVSTHGEWGEWISFFLEAVVAQSIDARRRIELLSDLHDSYRARVLASMHSRVALPAVDFVMEEVVVDAVRLAKYAKCHYATAKSALEGLSRLGIIKPTDTYPQRWIAQELLKSVYS